jgi:hypothetical protein
MHLLSKLLYQTGEDVRQASVAGCQPKACCFVRGLRQSCQRARLDVIVEDGEVVTEQRPLKVGNQVVNSTVPGPNILAGCIGQVCGAEVETAC